MCAHREHVTELGLVQREKRYTNKVFTTTRVVESWQGHNIWCTTGCNITSSKTLCTSNTGKRVVIKLRENYGPLGVYIRSIIW
jgi:hypothetical protein